MFIRFPILFDNHFEEVVWHSLESVKLIEPVQVEIERDSCFALHFSNIN